MILQFYNYSPDARAFMGCYPFMHQVHSVPERHRVNYLYLLTDHVVLSIGGNHLLC